MGLSEERKKLHEQRDFEFLLMGLLQNHAPPNFVSNNGKRDIVEFDYVYEHSCPELIRRIHLKWSFIPGTSLTLAVDAYKKEVAIYNGFPLHLSIKHSLLLGEWLAKISQLALLVDVFMDGYREHLFDRKDDDGLQGNT